MDKVDLIFKDARSSERALNKLFGTRRRKKTLGIASGSLMSGNIDETSGSLFYSFTEVIAFGLNNDSSSLKKESYEHSSQFR